MEELTCPHCGFFADSDSFGQVEGLDVETESGKKYRKCICPNCTEQFCITD